MLARTLLGLLLAVSVAGFVPVLALSERPQQENQVPANADAGQRELQGQLDNQLRSDPTLAGATLSSKVTEWAIILTGRVLSADQHAKALQIAGEYRGGRRIVDDLVLEPPPPAANPGTSPPGASPR